MFPSPPARPATPPGRLMTALAAFVLVLAACSGSAGPSPVTSSSAAIATAAPTATPLPTPSATPVPAFPATLKDDEGTSVTIASEPKRIVSLTPATTEILFGLGAGDRVVATDDGSDYPAPPRTSSTSRRSRRSTPSRSSSWAPTSSWPEASASHRPTRSPSYARSRSPSW